MQARIRGVDRDGQLNSRAVCSPWPPATSQSSPCGYSTIYGDAVGGYAPIKDLLKTRVWGDQPLA